MPLPDVAVEGDLSVHLVLVHVDRPVEQPHDRLDQARMAAEAAERLVVAMGREGGARGDSVLFAHHLLAVHGVDLARRLPEDRGLFGGEQTGQHEVAGLVEPVDLVVGQLHGRAPCVSGRDGKRLTGAGAAINAPGTASPVSS